METRQRRGRNAGRARTVVRVGVLLIGALGAAACAAILGIDDRGPVGANKDADIEAATDGSTSDVLVVDDAAGTADADAGDAGFVPVCDPALCGDAGGNCNPAGYCAFNCGANCAPNTTKSCPPGNDCRVNCANGGCDKVTCSGGRSCIIDCADGTCKNGISCEATSRCTVNCNGTSCTGGGPVECTAAACIVVCSGMGSCSEGISANATTYCGIRCTGSPSCAGMDKPVSCNATPDASIVCGNAANTCQKSRPTCSGQNCSIVCNDSTSCGQGVCCDAGKCTINPTRPNLCQ